LYTAAFSVTEIAPTPACGQHSFRSHDTRATDLNNLHATWFGNCLAQWNIAVSADSGHDRGAEFEGGFMPGILVFVRNWNACYRVLRYRKGFSFADSVHYGLWLARG
jgi:hypothetical protein